MSTPHLLQITQTVLSVTMFRLHVTYKSSKKILNVSSDIDTCEKLINYFTEKYSLETGKYNLQYWFQEEAFEDWVDLDDESLKAFIVGSSSVNRVKIMEVPETRSQDNCSVVLQSKEVTEELAQVETPLR